MIDLLYPTNDGERKLGGERGVQTHLIAFEHEIFCERKGDEYEM